jgi:hypothetical protein
MRQIMNKEARILTPLRSKRERHRTRYGQEGPGSAGYRRAFPFTVTLISSPRNSYELCSGFMVVDGLCW